MAADSELDQSRAVVKTYVPAYQKDEWVSHADELGMSQSEFVRSMVQAGRRGFGGDADVSTDDPEAKPLADTETDDSSPLEQHVLGWLSTDDHRTWDELVDRFEARLETSLKSMEDADIVEHSPRKGGYALAETDER